MRALIFSASPRRRAIACTSADGERPEERLLTWPLSAGVNLGWQYTAFQKAAFQYQLRFDPFVRDRTTAESFVVPSSTTTHGLGATWEYRRAGYSAVINGTWYRRSEWAPWGPAEALETGASSYAKYAAHLSKDVFLSTFQKVHLNAAYFGGTRLDRFSRYQFGLFDDTRIHGVPASGVRFDDVGMVRGSYSFNIFEQYRLDLFVDQAWGRDRSADSRWRPLTGLGAAVNLRAPFNTILRADVGKSFLPARYDERGIARVSGDDSETVEVRAMKADLHVHSWHSTQSGALQVSAQPRLLFRSRRRLSNGACARDGSGHHH